MPETPDGRPGRDLREHSLRALLLSVGGTLLFLGFLLLPRVQANPQLHAAFRVAAQLVLVWQALLLVGVLRGRRALRFQVVVKKAHWIQALNHGCIFAYWGAHWSPLIAQLPLVLAQVVFAYLLDMLLCWTRGRRFSLGFGQFPIVFSTNLLLWFRDDWFLLQFAMVATGVLGKEFLTWERDGRRTHIFNPSALSLTLAAFALMATRGTQATWGQEIATTLIYPEHIYLLIFGLGIVVQYFFRVTLMTFTSAAAVIGVGALYQNVTGVYFYVDSYIPIADFLGLHLLVTDPATSPKSDLGRTLFGTLYGVGVLATYSLLDYTGQPVYFDKILCVPLLNLLVPLLERAAAGLRTIGAGSRAGPGPPSGWARLGPDGRNYVYMALWTGFFAWMSMSGMFRPDHEGHQVQYWNRACQEGRFGACRVYRRVLEGYCRGSSGWSCNELGLLSVRGEQTPRDLHAARRRFRRACAFGLEAGCENQRVLAAGGTPGESSEPTLRDLYVMTLDRRGAGPDPDQGLVFWEEACRQSWPVACREAAREYLRAAHAEADGERARSLRARACELGLRRACAEPSEI